jgi:competence protein ComEA
VTAPLRALATAALLLASAPALAEAKKPLGPGDRIDLGRAGVAELMRLPGIGEKRAQAIVAARTKQPFRRPEDVLAVKGIGPKWLARVKDHVVVNGAAAPAAPPVAARKP